MPRALGLFFAMLMLLGMSGCINPLPTTKAEESDAQAMALLRESADAHGGLDRYNQLHDIAVSYDGQWLNNVWKFQEVLVDKGYRKASQERVVLRSEHSAWPVVAQRHTGPDGIKEVLWDGKRTHLMYGDGPGVDVLKDSKDVEVYSEAATVVAEAYRMFLTAPFYFLQRPGEVVVVPAKPDTVNGVACDQVLVRLEPGLGSSAADHVLVAIGKDDRLVHRVRFSLKGYRKTRNATADVVLSRHVTVAGLVWPTHFLETVRFPIDLEVHDWSMTGLDVDRGVDWPTLTPGHWSEPALRRARALPEASMSSPDDTAEPTP